MYVSKFVELREETKKGTAWFLVKGALTPSKKANIYSGYSTLRKISMKTNKILLTFYPLISNYPFHNLCQYKKIPALNSTFLSWYLKWVLTMCPLYTLDITFWTLKKTVTLHNFRIFRSQVSTLFILPQHYTLKTHCFYYIRILSSSQDAYQPKYIDIFWLFWE